MYNGYQLKSSGQYPRVISTNSGCEQIEILNLNVIPAIAVNQLIGICEGETFTVGNQTFNQSGIYQIVFPASNGCDSLVTTNLTVESLNAQISLVDNVYSALNAPVDATFQWLDCNLNFAPLIAEENPSSIASSNGNYAVEMSNGNCRDTSNCLAFLSLDLPSITSNQFKVYPIPANETLIIESEFSNLPIRILDAQGRLIFETTSISKRMEIDLRLFQSGLYFMQSNNISKPFTILHNR